MAFFLVVGCVALVAGAVQPQDTAPAPVARFPFDGTVNDAVGSREIASAASGTAFVSGLEGQALSVASDGSTARLAIDRDSLPLGREQDFSVQYWVRTVADSGRRMVLLSQKNVADNSLAAQKRAGWVYYFSDGTWAWSIGSGSRRLTYERDNGERMPLNDGRWHQLTMTYDGGLAEVRLYYDGLNKVVYNVADGVGFDFTNGAPLVIGWDGTRPSPEAAIVPSIYAGAENLQALVDTFNGYGLNEVTPDELVSLIVEPERFFARKVDERAEQLGNGGAALREAMQAVDLAPISEIEDALMDNPYTIHQAFSFMEAAPLMKIYALVDGEIVINEEAARLYTEGERLYPPDFDIDNLAVWDRPLTAAEVRNGYAEHFVPAATELETKLASVTAGAWNIFHGGKHFTTREHGWDSRRAIAEILRREDVDVVMMQETYSSGDYIAAELGYYFATTVDWDYLNQGANISVLSRYPILEVHVESESPFMNVGAKVAVSDTQDMYVMSNWYGIQQFSAVFDFHRGRFAESDTTPTVFGGDFNAVPHTDGGNSPASPVMLDAGFTDAFRSFFPDVARYPGATHRNGRRIDQLYFKGAGLRHTSTKLVTTWPTGFPSDHNLIVSTFNLQ